MKLLLTTLFLLTTAFYGISQDVGKRVIEYTEEFSYTEYTHSDGTTSMGGAGVNYQWRYKGDSTWRSIGKRGKVIKPIFAQYKSSKRSFNQAKVLFVTPYLGSAVALGGGHLFFVGRRRIIVDLYGEKEVPSGTRAIQAGGIVIFAVGFAAALVSFPLAFTKFKEAFDNYNKEVSSEASLMRKKKSLSLNISGETYDLMNGGGIKLSLQF